ncbi:MULTISPECIES: hypothetical protein [Streptomyces]|uniref:Uncharacterized protein n=2 Tax=Streptomyces TaxID=1883 RepID=A0A1E7LJE8_9ACTN|nr:hypothetical protein [Streptomyces nanshensis]OEV16350.1 hypothetical protein AN221_32615 [Streptomyces nanshensis]
MTETARQHVVIRAEIEIGDVRYSTHYAVPARSWEIADEHMRQTMRDGARQQLADHLAAELPITITNYTTPAPAAG